MKLTCQIINLEETKANEIKMDLEENLKKI